MCPGCQQPVDQCQCQAEDAYQGDGIARVRRETKGRGGKTVTTIQGLPLDKKGLSDLTKQLKRRCGTGGAVKQGVIEIQGDWVEVLLEELQKKGYTAKRSGG